MRPFRDEASLEYERLKRPTLDLPRLLRFLVEHEEDFITQQGETVIYCIACPAKLEGQATKLPHLPDCEWLALVEMTRPDQRLICAVLHCPEPAIVGGYCQTHIIPGSA